MRGGVSKDGGNASSAGEPDHGEPYAGTKSETTDTAKGMHLQSGSVREDNQRAGCLPRGGIRKACGEQPGRNQGGPPPRVTGRPKVGQGRARTMGAKAFSFTHRIKVFADGTVGKIKA